MTRRDRQKRKLLVFVVMAAVVWLLAFTGGVAFELGRWFARRDTDNALAPVEEWFR